MAGFYLHSPDWNAWATAGWKVAPGRVPDGRPTANCAVRPERCGGGVVTSEVDSEGVTLHGSYNLR